MKGRDILRALFAMPLVITLISCTETGQLKCHNMVCTGDVDWKDKICTKRKSPNQPLGECNNAKWCSKSEGADKYGRRLSIHECSFSCSQWDKFRYNDMFLEQYCCRGSDMCNSGNRPTTWQLLFLPSIVSIFRVVWR